MRRLPVLAAALWALVSPSLAQAPAPAQMGLTPTTPGILEVLDASRTWTPLGSVDPTLHTFTPVWETVAYATTQGVRGSADFSRTATISTGSMVATLSAIGDFQVGDYARQVAAGAPYAAGAPANLTAVQNGAPGATRCTYWVANDDGAGGLSAAVSVIIFNANAAQTTANPVHLAYTPPVSDQVGAVWKDCGAGETWIGAAQTAVVATMTPGFGYTPGAYSYVAAGGGCLVPPRGWYLVKADGTIATDFGGIETGFPGKGCTYPPTVTVSAARAFDEACLEQLEGESPDQLSPLDTSSCATHGPGAQGVDGAVTLALTATLDDAGWVPGFRPYYVPIVHPAAGQCDWLVAQITAISNLQATLAAPAGCSATGTSFRHSWTQQIQTTVNIAGAGGLWGNVVEALLPCGTFEIDQGIFIGATNTVLAGGGPGCTALRHAGTGNTVQIGDGSVQINYSGVKGIYFVGNDKESGYNVSSLRTGYNTVFENLRDNVSPCGYQALGFNNIVLRQITGNNGWAGGCADYDLESTFAYHSLVPVIDTVYHNDAAVNNVANKTGITTHDGWRINNVSSGYCLGEMAISDAPGAGYNFYDNTGNIFTTSIGMFGNNHWTCPTVAAEYSMLDEFHFVHCADCYFAGFTNGSQFGYEIQTLTPPYSYNNLNQQGVQWLGGKLNGARMGAVKFGGPYVNILANTMLMANSISAPGTYPAVECASSCNIHDNYIGNIQQPTYHKAPVQLDLVANPALTANVHGNTFAVNTGTADVPIWKGNLNNFVITDAPALVRAETSGNVDVSCNVGPINDCTAALGQNGAPLILPSSGTVADAAANIILNTPLDQIYPNAWMYFPANALTPGGFAGMYFTQCSSQVACKAFQNYRPVSGTCFRTSPKIPGSLTPFTAAVSGPFTQTVGVNANLFCVSLPPYQVSANGGLTINASATYLNSATVKTIGNNIGGYGFGSSGVGLTTTHYWAGISGFRNIGVENVQYPIANGGALAAASYGTSVNAPTPGAIDMTAAQDLVVNCNLATAATDYCVLQNISVTQMPGIN